MKKIIFAVLVILTFGLNSCYDEKMEWNDPYTHPADKDLPLELQEKISRYDALNAYTTFTLGAGIDFNLYMNDEAYRNIVNQNFDEITPGNEMKQSSVMNAQGELDFSKIDPVIAQLKAAGLSIYGHTLVWHSQQQATYLNGLIAPEVKPGAAGENQLENGSFEEGMDGWGSWGNKTSVDIAADQHIDGEQSLKIVINGSSGAVYGMQLQSPAVPLVIGHRYRIAFYIKSDIPGAVRISFDNSLPASPFGGTSSFWPGNNAADGPDNTISTSVVWKQVIYDNEHSSYDFTAAANSVQIRFDLGLLPNVTYYLDLVEVIDLDAEPAEPTYVNMVAHGTFDEYANSDALYPDWNSWGGTASPTRELSAEGEGYGDKGKCLIIHSAGGSQDYSVQATTNLTESFIVGHEYHVEAMMKSSVSNGAARIQFQGGDATYLDADAVTNVWMKISHDFTATNANDKLFFDLGKAPADYYIDNVVVYDKATLSAVSKKTVFRSGPVIIEKSDEEKARILTGAMESWVSQMLGRLKGDVHAWDVVNEPMDDSGNGLKTGIGKTLGANDFYWQDYLGKDYAVLAFKFARQHGNSGDQLFINEYGLEGADGNKLDGLIKYVEYIESQGAKVDGIGTQMHLNINWADTAAIVSMFQKLAATGKLIKISELDVALSSESNGSNSPANPISSTPEELQEQAYLYEFVAKAYTQYIPEAQRYGITVWGVSDNENEHKYWLKNDAPCLWNAKYARKHAYKGFADGLAGRDVSVDFPGTLVP